MKKFFFTFSLFVVACQLASAKSKNHDPVPYHGLVNGTMYSNEFFNITWEFPKEWTVKDIPAPEPHSHYYSLLTLLPSGNQGGEEVSLSAQDFSAVYGFWHQYLDQMKSTFTKKGWITVGKRTTNYQLGTPGETEEFASVDGKHYVAILSAPLHNYELRFYVSAATHDRIESLLKALSGVKCVPDWPEHPPAETIGEPLNISPDSLTAAGLSPGKLIHRVNPDYPAVARMARVQGNVVLYGEIGKEGKVVRLFVLQGNPLLADSAVEAVSQWQYLPYKMHGSPVAVQTEVVVNFSLASSP